MTQIGDTESKLRFLVFSRDYIVADFQKSFDPVSDIFEFAYLTDGQAAGAGDTRKIFYDALGKGRMSPDLDPGDVEDVVSRCRLLRNIGRVDAEKLAHAMAISLAHHIDAYKPHALISQMVDEYVSHLFAILAKKRGLGYLGYCAGYFPGTSLLLSDAHGRPYNWRAASDEEVGQRLQKVSGTAFRQTYSLGAGYSFGRHLKAMLRYRAKILWFGLRRRIENDPWNLHYRVTPHIAERRHLRDYPGSAMFSADWAADLASLRKEKPSAKIFYLPLSYFPESTIDYWVLDKRMIDYCAMILRIAEALSSNHIVIVKEHLHMMGARDGSFLRTLRAMPGVVSVPPLELSNVVVAESDLVLLGSGSPGIEATLRGKPVATFCDTSYWYEPAGAALLSLDEISCWADKLADFSDRHKPLDSTEQHAFVRACLASSTHVAEARTIWPILDPEDLKHLLPAVAQDRAS